MFKKYPKVAVLSITVFIAMAILLLTEMTLRVNGESPGVINAFENAEFDKVYSFDEFIADEQGIMKVNPDHARVLAKQLQSQENVTSSSNALAEALSTVYSSFYPINRGIYEKWEFDKTVRLINAKDSSELSPLERSVLNYTRSPINKNGFRSISFSEPVDASKILLIGDSFVWGSNAYPLTSSFSDILLARGYHIYNTGIPAADPAQYAAIAKQYIPKLEPEIVIVNFYLGNDQMHYIREVLPDRPLYWDTNLGFLLSFQNGCYLDFNEAREFAMHHLTMPVDNKNINHYFSKTVLSTRLWVILKRLQYLMFDEPNCNNEYYETPRSEFYINQIKAVCEKLNVKMFLLLIPDNHDQEWNNSLFNKFKKQAKLNFPNTEYHYLNDLAPVDFADGDTHFSNDGHAKYADFLQMIIDRQLNNSKSTPFSN